MIIRLCLLLVLCAGSGAHAIAQSGAGTSSAGSVGDPEVRAERLRAWQQLDPADQARLRARFETLRALPDEERATLTERAGRLRREMTATLASLPEGEKAAIEAMPSKQRTRLLRTLIADRAHEAAGRLRQRLTAEERGRLESATPGERAKILRHVRQREQSRLPDQLDKLARAMGLNRVEMAKIQHGTDAEKRAAIAAFVRRRARAHVRKNGLPAPLSAEEWTRVLEQDDRPFLRAVMRIRARHPEFGIPKERWEKRLSQRFALQRRLAALATPSARDRLRRPGSGAERSQRSDRTDRDVILRNRDRAHEVLARHAGWSPEDEARVRALSGDDFVRAYRFLLRALEAGGEPQPAISRWFDRRTGSRQ